MQTAVIERGPTRGWLDDRLDALRPGEPLPAGDPSRIGVVFVHGIGSQRPGETLLSWSRRLLRVLGTWSATHGGPYHLVRRASIDFTGSTLPYVEVGLPAHGDHPAQTWVMTEAWWAAQVQPPSIGEMAGWLARGEGMRVLKGIAGGLGGSLGLPTRWVEVAVVRLVLLGAFAVALTLYAVSRILRLLPIPGLQRGLLVRSFDYFLGDWFGDVRVMLLDRAQAASVRSRLRRAIYALRAYGCGPIVLVGHSGGTFVSYMALAEKREDELPVARLITHGQALGLAWNLGRACEDPDPGDEDRLQAGDLLRIPLSVARPTLEWFDFWASHDPAPAGGFERTACTIDAPRPPGGSTMVRNRGSALADHGAYWDNTEQFVVPVARLIETASPATRTSRLLDDDRLASAQAVRSRRVARLSLTKTWIGGAAVLAALVVGPLGSVADATFGRQPGNIVTVGREVYPAVAWAAGPLAALSEVVGLVDLPAEPTDLVAGLIGLVVAVLAFLAVEKAADWIWDGWDTAHRRALLDRAAAVPSLRGLNAHLGLLWLAAVLVVLFVAAGRWWWLVAALGLTALALAWRLRVTRSAGSGSAAAGTGGSPGLAPSPIPRAERRTGGVPHGRTLVSWREPTSLWPSPAHLGGSTMPDHPNATVIRTAMEAMNQGDMSRLDEFVADDIVWHMIGSPEPLRGKGALREIFSGTGVNYEITGEVHDVVANDEHAIALVDATATRGGRTFKYRTAEIFHVRDGKVTERWAFSDDTAAISAFFGPG